MDKKIVVIGGGTGTYTALTGLKKYTPNLSAIVTMMDSGGSSGRLRDEFGSLPPGDVRQALVALSADTSTMRDLFNYRYDKGEGLEGHNFGNLFLTTLSQVTGGMDKAIAETSLILNIKGKVLPVTTDNASLVAEFENGLVVEGEGKIDEPEHDGDLRINKVYLKPSAKAYPESLEAITQADLIVLGPGDLFTSLVPNLLVEGVPEAICSSKARKAYVVNLMTKFGQTSHFTATDHVQVIQKYLGKDCLDFVFINTTAFPTVILHRYEEEHGEPVKDDLKENHYKIVRADLLASSGVRKKAGDILRRSLIRHDSDKLAKAFVEVL